MMPAYFKPLRRKIGVFTLLIACIFMAGWVRSSFCSDVINTSVWNTIQSIRTTKAGLLWVSEEYPGTMFGFCPQIQLGNASTWDFQGPWQLEWKSCGIKFGEGHFENIQAGITFNVRAKYWIIPFWLIVIPLTLLSVWLLLSRPRAQKSPA